MSSRSCDTVSIKTSVGIGALYPGTSGGLFGVTAAAVDLGSVAGGEDGFVDAPSAVFATGLATAACFSFGAAVVAVGAAGGLVELVAAAPAPVSVLATAGFTGGGEAGCGAEGIALTAGSLALAAVAVVRVAFAAGLGSAPLPAALALLSGAKGGCSGATPCATIVCFATARAWSRSWILLA